MNVKDKVILVTGGAGGLGAVMVELLCKNGAKLYILDLDETKGKELEAQLTENKVTATFIQMDLTSEEAWKQTIDTIVTKEGRIDVLVNNAGINIRKPIEEMVISEFNTMMLVNVGSVFLGTKYVIPVMRKQGGGAIINTSSVCGLIGHRYTPEAYTTTKGAVTLLTKAIASRYGSENIRCNSIHPSTVDTPLVQEMFKDPAKKQQRFDEVPLGRLATPEDVANSVLYLASEEASFINGVALPVDGGVTCC
ncbi:SDR family oxidoreductase [Sphaerochaeta halotolerans]|uniref:SDR family oxidoreductase n=1 Tax=Sphaerochaeta halotolerans TaxID=2293840 RepID=A0A372MF94_9SPIR|nr:glucose 1-dehydrogenase [Sphaerochaeta halotolerans]RFU93966.1 SDR family oxidoreductase [Sphaerochaeta halotolerans]